ncbi:ATP-dependent DNA helicase Rep OS=Stutzerimonas stutzeri OX=316 GN=rep PE=3 SV=1 [Stutzerimonas stutzeri]
MDQHASVLAVAGSGKSTTMAERIAYLIEAKRVDPAHVIAVMFNKAASVELAEKLEKRLGKRNAPASVTYHRLGTLTLARLVRERKAEAWDFDASPHRAQGFAARILEPYCKRYGFEYPRFVADVFLGYVDRVKGDLVSPREAWENGELGERYEWFVNMYPLYEKARTKHKKRFFSDLIYDPVMIMRENPEAAALIADRYEHIIVDEYQDICESQQSLVRYVAGQKARVMVVGDDDQTIYTWRGAKPSYILRDFHNDFPGGVTYRLTRTWRYGHALSCAANYVITGNMDRADKLCISGDKAPATELFLEWEEIAPASPGSTLMKIVNQWIEKGGKLTDIAILVRAYSKSGSSQFALLQSGVPFRLEGGDDVSVLSNEWVKALLGWMSLAAGLIAERPYAGEPDAGSIIQIKQLINVPKMELSWEGMNLLAKMVLLEPDNGDGFSRFVNEYLKVSDGLLSEKIYYRGKLWRKIRSLVPSANKVHPIELLEQLVVALDVKGTIYRKASAENLAEEQWSLVEAFINYVRANAQDKTLKQFLNHIDDLKTFSERAKVSTQAIHMTSVHRSKGLEWPCVIMIGLAQGSFPLKPKKKLKDDKLDRHLEDERRLFYVGMTRAQRALYLLSPPDDDLHNWLTAGCTGSPAVLAENGQCASQFLYESNLYLAMRMPYIISRNLALKAGSPEVANAYLEALGHPARVEKIKLKLST